MSFRRGLIGAALSVLALCPASAGADVVFTSHRCDDGGRPMPGTGLCTSSIWRMADDGSDQRRLTVGANAGGGDSWPSWDLLGRRVFFARATDHTFGASRIWSMEPDGSDQRPMTPPGESDGFGYSAPEDQPSVSPDGAMVAFVSGRRGGGGHAEQIWLMRSDGSELRQLTDDPGDHDVPRFSPDGQRLIYLHRPPTQLPGGPARLVTRSLHGGAPLEVIDTSAQLHSALAFSPDGRGIALSMHRTLYTLDLLTGRLRRVGPYYAAGVTWSIRDELFFGGIPSGGGYLDLSRVAVDGAAPPVAFGKGELPSWSAAGVLGLELPKLDTLAPVVALLPSLPSVDGAPAARAAASGRPVGLLAVDPSGVRSVRVAVAREARRGRCRPLLRGRLRTARACRPAPYVRAGADRFARMTRGLPPGRYRAWFRTEDGAGNDGRRTLRFTLSG
jgi:dipeptidyl aminopeptidase/acylaminoacyl peptidase